MKLIQWRNTWVLAVSGLLFSNAFAQVQELDIELANEYAVFAMMASNTYLNEHDRTYFDLEQLGWSQLDLEGNVISPKKIRQNSYTPSTWFGRLFSNLQFDIWENGETNKIVFAFKGTDETIDWLNGNSSIGISIPYKSAKKKVKTFISLMRDGNRNPEVWLVGHSLGGGIALSVSVWEGLPTITFNPSPRIFDGWGDYNEPAKRIVIFQEGDVLEKLRKRYPKFVNKIPPEDIIQTSFNYGDRNNHRADLLAEGFLSCADEKQLEDFAGALSITVQCDY